MDHRKLEESRKARAVFLVALAAAHLVVPVGVILATRIGRVRFAGLLGYVTVGLLVFDGLLLLIWIDTPADDWSGSPWWITDGRTLLTLQALVVTVFSLVGRGVIAYGLTAIATVGLLARGVSRERHTVTLGLVFTLGVSLILSELFTVAYLARTFDTIKHAEIISRIVTDGTGRHFRGRRFNGFLLYHYLGGALTLLGSITSRSAAGLVGAVGFGGSALCTYGFVRRWTGRERLGVIAATLLVVTPAFLEWGGKAHYQSLSFVYLTVIAMCTASVSRNRRFLLIGSLVTVSWIGTHHFSLVMGLTLLATPVGVNALQTLRRRSIPNPVGPLLAGGALFKWSVLTNWIRAPFRWVRKNAGGIADTTPNATPTDTTPDTTPTDTTPDTTPTDTAPTTSTDTATTPDTPTGGIDVTSLQVKVRDSTATLLRSSLPFFLDYLYFAGYMALVTLGVLRLGVRRFDRYGPLLLAGVVASVFYFPNPAWLPLRGIAEFQRWDIMAAPFVVVLAAAGVLAAVELGAVETQARRLAAVVGVIGLVFLTVSSGFYAPTTSDLIGADRHDQEYLSSADVRAGGWTLQHSSTTEPVYATSTLNGYLAFVSEPVLRTGGYSFRRARVTNESGTVVFPRGLTLFQQRGFTQESVRVDYSPTAGYYPEGVVVTAPVSGDTVSYSPNDADMVYDNGETVVHWSNETRGEA